MARSRLGERQVRDTDFLSEAEFAVSSGTLQTDIDSRLSSLAGDAFPQLSGDLDCQDNIIQGDIENNLNTLKFGADILGLMADPKLLNVACEDLSSGATPYKDLSGGLHHGTPSGTWVSGNRLKQGRSWVLSPNGTDAYIDFGDNDDFSFGDGNNDSPVTFFGMIEVIGTATYQRIIAKHDATASSELREWFISLNASEKLCVFLIDESAKALLYRITDDALSTGKHSFVVTYSGVGGGAAADGITIYVDGVLVVSTATNDANYVAMENLSTSVLIGANIDSGGMPGYFMQGDFGCLGVEASVWSSATVWVFHQLCLANYSENGDTL